MSLALVPEPDYAGAGGIEQIDSLRRQLRAALRGEDWQRVRELDRSCAALVDRVLNAHCGDSAALARELTELKSLYAELIDRCQDEVLRLAL